MSYRGTVALANNIYHYANIKISSVYSCITKSWQIANAIQALLDVLSRLLLGIEISVKVWTPILVWSRECNNT